MRGCSDEQFPELGARTVKAGLDGLLADPQNHCGFSLAHIIDTAAKEYLAQILRQQINRPANSRKLALVGRLGIGCGAIARHMLRAFERKRAGERSAEHTSARQTLMRISYTAFWLKKKK